MRIRRESTDPSRCSSTGCSDPERPWPPLSRDFFRERAPRARLAAGARQTSAERKCHAELTQFVLARNVGWLKIDCMGTEREPVKGRILVGESDAVAARAMTEALAAEGYE